MTSCSDQIARWHVLAEPVVADVGVAIIVKRIVLCVRTIPAAEQHNVVRIALDDLETIPREVEVDIAATIVAIALNHELARTSWSCLLGMH